MQFCIFLRGFQEGYSSKRHHFTACRTVSEPTASLAAVNPQGRLLMQLTACRLLLMGAEPIAPTCVVFPSAVTWVDDSPTTTTFLLLLFPRARGSWAGGVPEPGENTHWTRGHGSCVAASPCHALGPSEYFPQAPGNWNTVSASGAEGPTQLQAAASSELAVIWCDFPAGRWACGGARGFIFNSSHHYFEISHSLFWF